MSRAIETTELCSYGCGNRAKYINDSGKLMCLPSHNSCPFIKEKNAKGLKKSYETGKRIPAKNLYQTYSQEKKDRMVAWCKGKTFEPEFKYDGKGKHKNWLIQELGHQCQSCNLKEWLGSPIPLELEHKDGDNRNNERDNLLLLCPNCHTRTKFYRGRGINNGKMKVSEEEIIAELQRGLTIRQTLINLRLTPKGGNYKRVYEAQERLHGEIGRRA